MKQAAESICFQRLAGCGRRTRTSNRQLCAAVQVWFWLRWEHLPSFLLGKNTICSCLLRWFYPVPIAYGSRFGQAKDEISQVNSYPTDGNSGQSFYIQRCVRTAHQADPAILSGVGTTAAPAAGCAIRHGNGGSIFGIEGNFLVFHTTVPAVRRGFG